MSGYFQPPPLPVVPVLTDLRAVLRRHRGAVLQAPPGAGKTTLVPLALLEETWLRGRRVVMLEPRRLAARAAAHRMASLLGERVGQTVGYRVRMDTRVGPQTRVEVVTEGVLTRMLQADAALEGVGVVIFDEYHERSLHADLGLALALQCQAVLREDLRLLAMSATLDGDPVAELLGGVPALSSEGRGHAVEVRYLPRRWEGAVEGLTARTVREALRGEPGDVLVFLPGAAEIRRVERALAREALPANTAVMPLYGSLPQQEQERAIAPSAPGSRKVVLATSIAETSLTIEGVRVVVDSGLMRVPRFSPRTGMTRLETVRVSRASAEQRRGRAGRVAPGVCYRLWSEPEQAQLVPFSTPEILEADLAPLALELAVWGVADPGEMSWLDAPPPAAFAQARELLTELGALNRDGTIVPHGRAMAELPLHPRLAHMLLTARKMGHGALACDLAALLGDRDVFRGEGGPPDADLRLRLAALEAARGGAGELRRWPQAHRGGLFRARKEADHWRRRLRVGGGRAEPQAAGLLLALAYPDRIGQRRPGSADRYLLSNGRGAALPRAQALSRAEYLVAAEVDGQGRESRVYLAAPVEQAELEQHLATRIRSEEEIGWDPESRSLLARRVERLGALVLREAPLAAPDPEALADALLEGVAAEGIAALPWSKAARQLQQRLGFLHHHDPSWPDASDAALAADPARWLRPFLYGMRRWSDVQRLDLMEVLLAPLPWERRSALDELAPSHCEVPSGSRLPIDYSDPDAPVLAVRLQEVFGLEETPRVARGRVPLTLHLLSPAHRPVQVTRDLGSFWRHAYFEVRKDLKGRYPRHYWPDEPLRAEATRRAKPR